MARPSHREAILDAAEQVAITQGAARITLDAVAAAAGMGKGGLIYHFPSKQALLDGLVERLCSRYQACVDSGRADPASGANPLQAHLAALAMAHERSDQLATAIIAVAANAPGLLKSAAERQRQVLAPLLAQGEAGARAVALHFAINGVFLLEQLGAVALSRAERDRIIASILALAGETGQQLARDHGT